MKFVDGKVIKNKKKTIILVLVSVFLLAMIVSAVLVRNNYYQNLKPLSSTSKTHVVTIQPGSTPGEIARTLKTKNVIKSDWAFEWYVRNHQANNELKAGTYVFDQNQSVQEIVEIIMSGKVATDLLTILPGKNLDQIKADLVKAGFTTQEIEKALEPTQYAKHPALVDKPASASLEGYLYPETFQKTAETSLKDIITLSLDEMALRLTSEVRSEIAKNGLTVHQAITLASIIEGEVSSPEDRAKVAQVFLKRLDEGIRLESNATDEFSKTKPEYNTYKIDGLPPGPISNFTDSAIKAVAYPAGTDWLFSVTGDNGVNHFSKTLEEHEANIVKYCTTLCGR